MLSIYTNKCHTTFIIIIIILLLLHQLCGPLNNNLDVHFITYSFIKMVYRYYYFRLLDINTFS